jgi:hypothetical protein
MRDTQEIKEKFGAANPVYGVEGCAICKKCSYPDKQCRFPDKMCPSIEGAGSAACALSHFLIVRESGLPHSGTFGRAVFAAQSPFMPARSAQTPAAFPVRTPNGNGTFSPNPKVPPRCF